MLVKMTGHGDVGREINRKRKAGATCPHYRLAVDGEGGVGEHGKGQPGGLDGGLVR